MAYRTGLTDPPPGPRAGIKYNIRKPAGNNFPQCHGVGPDPAAAHRLAPARASGSSSEQRVAGVVARSEACWHISRRITPENQCGLCSRDIMALCPLEHMESRCRRSGSGHTDQTSTLTSSAYNGWALASVKTWRWGFIRGGRCPAQVRLAHRRMDCHEMISESVHLPPR